MFVAFSEYMNFIQTKIGLIKKLNCDIYRRIEIGYKAFRTKFRIGAWKCGSLTSRKTALMKSVHTAKRSVVTAKLKNTQYDQIIFASSYLFWCTYIFFHEIFLQFLKYVMYLLIILEINCIKVILLLQKGIYIFYPLLNTRNEISTAIEDSNVAYSFLLVLFLLSFFSELN